MSEPLAAPDSPPAPDAPAAPSLEERLRRVEDELAIQRLLLSYGPAADAGLAAAAANLWTEDGAYDWDAARPALTGRNAVERMLLGENHHRLLAEGVAHMAGPAAIEVDGDSARAVNYSLIVRREGERFYVWRASAVLWELTRAGDSWRVTRRTNRLLDETGAGRELFGATVAHSTAAAQR